MERSVLERRMKMLGSYMHELCQSHIINAHHGLRDLLMGFLEQGDYDRATSGGPISHTVSIEHQNTRPTTSNVSYLYYILII